MTCLKVAKSICYVCACDVVNCEMNDDVSESMLNGMKYARE